MPKRQTERGKQCVMKGVKHWGKTQTERNEGGSAQEDNREDTKTESDRWGKKYLLTNGDYVLE